VDSELATARLTLRRFTPADAEGLLALDGDREVMRFIDRHTKSLAEIEAQVLPRFLGFHTRHPGFGFWAADIRGENTFAGWFGLRAVEPSADAMVHWPDAAGEASVAELGYRLRRSAWGRGYATEGARALVHWAFTELGVSEVAATTMAVNTASRAVMEKAGLRYARTIHVDWATPLPGTEHGEVEYRLHRDDWSPR
jgi:RimJ/RimL family protein N-acetyltransferase